MSDSQRTQSEGAGDGVPPKPTRVGASDSPRNRRVLEIAQQEARRLHHNFVGTEQLLLGIIGEGTGIAASVLRDRGVRLQNARLEVEKIIGVGSGFVAVEIPFTPRAKRVLELAWEQARQLGDNFIGPEHLFIGLLQEKEGVAASVLAAFGLEPEDLKHEVLRRKISGLKTEDESQDLS